MPTDSSVSDVNREPQVAPEGGEARLRVLLGVLVFLACLVPFVSALGGPWLFDDRLLIEHNRLVKSWGLVGHWFQSEFFDAPLSDTRLAQSLSYYRPLVVASYALDWSLGSGTPFVFHVTNLLIHSLVGVLAYVTLLRWVGSTWGAYWGALLFALHPTKAESVGWISGRPDPLYVLFLLLSLHCLARLRARPAARSMLPWLGTIVFGALSLLCKESAVLLPVFFAVEIYLADGCPRLERPWLRRTMPYLGAAGALVGLYLIVRTTLLSSFLVNTELGGLGERARLALQTWGRLAQQLIYPTDLSMFASAARYENGQLSVRVHEAALGAAAAVSVSVFGIVLWMRRGSALARRSLALLTLAVVALFPGLEIVPTGLVMSAQARFWYLSLLPIGGLFGLLFRKRRRWGQGLAAALVLASVVLCWRRSACFESSSSFWDYEMKRNPAVPGVLQARLRMDAKSGGLRLRGRRANCALEQSLEFFRGHVAHSFLGELFDVTYLGEVDGSERLREAAQFVSRVRNGHDAELKSSLGLRIAANSKLAEGMRSEQARWMLREAEYWIRYGDFRKGRELLAQLKSACPKCEDMLLRAAHLALFVGDEKLAQRYIRPSGEQTLIRSTQAARLLHRHRKVASLAASFEVSRAWHLLGEPSWAYRALLPYDLQVKEGFDEKAKMSWAMVCVAAGDIDRAVAIFDLLSQRAQEELKEQGFPSPTEGRDEPFVSGTCALPSELN